MNKTRKGAMAVMVISILLLVFSMTIPLAWLYKVPVLKILPLVFLVLSYIAMGLSIIFFRKKQSPSEPDFDERDRIIKRKAILASYITLWILVFLGCTIPFMITDQCGIMPVSLLPIALFIMFIIVMLVYSLTILMQYGRGE